MEFKLWSEVNKEAKGILSPDFGLRSWNDVSANEKNSVWQYMQLYFFNKNMKTDYSYLNRGDYFEFYDPEPGEKQERILNSIMWLNKLHKARSYAKKFLENPSYNSACSDFYSIFIKESEHVVIELLSLYSKALIEEKQNEYKLYNKKEAHALLWNAFDQFAKHLNEVFSQFGLNVHLTRSGFVPKQEEKIIEDLYEPVINALSNPQWKEVNVILSDAFLEYRKNTPQGYSTCVTHAVSAVQAFLQLLVNGRTGTGDISKLIVEARNKSLIPSDLFTKELFKNIESVLMSERQKTGVAHPKAEYATAKNAQMVLNLAMIFIQHCILS